MSRSKLKIAELLEAGHVEFGSLTEPRAKELVSAFGVPVPNGRFVQEVPDLCEAFLTLSPPVVLKLVSPDVMHKSDVGAVQLGLTDAEGVVKAANAMLADYRLQDARVEGFLLEEMRTDALELAIGGVIDPAFGPVLMLGLGGIFLELLDDVAFRIVPASRDDIVEMMEELRSYPILKGSRARYLVDIDEVIEVALRIGGRNSLLDIYRGMIAELDINPLLVGNGPPVAADVRIVIRPSDELERTGIVVGTA